MLDRCSGNIKEYRRKGRQDGLGTPVPYCGLEMKLTTANPRLRADIRSVQSQLKSAIQNHQMILFKLKDRPVSIKLRVQMTNAQRHIVSLGEKQKKLLQELRKEMEASGGFLKIDQKPSLKALQNLRHNPINQIPSSKSVNLKKELEIKKELLEAEEIHAVPQKPTTGAHTSKRKSKQVALTDGPITNGHGTPQSSSPSQKENTPSSTPSSSPTHSGSTNKQPRQRTPKQGSVPPSSASDESQDTYIHVPADPELRRKLQFMTALSLVTREVLTELQNRRTERKRRSTANPQFLYGNMADPKRKKPLYLTNSATKPAAEVSADVTDSAHSVKQVKSEETLTCFECSSKQGLLNKCALCQRVFHWSCVLTADNPPPSEESSVCPTCEESVRSKAETGGTE